MMIRQKPDIISIIETCTELKKRGRYLWGLCPLPDHMEKTPSFKVDPEQQSFYCFGCHTHGDVIAFVMIREKLPFKEAISRLGINGKPYNPDPREIRKRDLIKAFRYWCNDYHDDLCALFRTFRKAKEKAKDIKEVETLAKFYHQEMEWLYQIEVLQGRDDNKKIKLYKRYLDGLI